MRTNLTSNRLCVYKIMLLVIFDLYTKLVEQPARVDWSGTYILVVKCNQNKSKKMNKSDAGNLLNVYKYIYIKYLGINIIIIW